jgi:hypothetical protein
MYLALIVAIVLLLLQRTRIKNYHYRHRHYIVFSLDGPEWVVNPRCVSSFSLFLREADRYSARLLRLCTITVFI